MRLPEELLKKLVDNIVAKFEFKQSDSGYYLTTDEIKSKKLYDNYGVEYVRIYIHLPTEHKCLMIKYADGEIEKYFDLDIDVNKLNYKRRGSGVNNVKATTKKKGKRGRKKKSKSD